MLCLALKRTGCWACERKLSSFSTDSPGQLEVFGHDGDPLGVNAAQVGVLEQPDEVRLGPLMQRLEGRRLEPDVKNLMWTEW